MTKNPFTPHTYAYKNFAGRLEHIEDFIETIDKLDSAKTLLIFGETGVGKTSLLRQFEGISKKKGCIPVYIGRGWDSPESLFSYIETEIEKNVLSIVKRKWKVLKDSFKSFSFKVVTFEKKEPKETTMKFLTEVSNVFNEINKKGYRLVLFLDQAEKLADFEMALNTITNLIENMSHERAKVFFITAIRSEKYYEIHYLQPTFSRLFSKSIKLQLLSDHEVRIAITEPLKGTNLKFEKEVVDAIVSNAKGSPFIIQKICHELFSAKKKGNVSMTDFDKIGKKVLDEIFTEDMKRIKTDAQREIVKTIAMMGDMRIESLIEYADLERDEIKEGLEHLRNERLIIWDKGIYSLYHDRFKEHIIGELSGKERDLLFYKGLSESIMGYFERGEEKTAMELLTDSFIEKIKEKGIESAKDKLVKKLTGVLSDKESDVRWRAASALGSIGSERVIEPLIKALTTDKERGLRENAAVVLARMGSDKAIEPLIKVLATAKQRDVRVNAVFALGSIGSERVIKPLIKALTTDKESHVREKAAYALEMMGSDKAIEPLIKALTTAKQRDVREKAADALGRIGSEKVIEPLIKALTTDKESDVRGGAAGALARMGSDKAIEPLIKALTTDKESDVRGRAAYALGRIGSEKAIEVLIKVLTTDKESRVRSWAAGTLGWMGGEKALQPLIKALTTDKESDVRSSAASGLGSTRSEKAVQPLIKALTTDKESDVRGEAADALGSTRSEKAVQPLIKALTTDKESDVRGEAADALGSIGSEKAIEPLKSALKDEGEWAGEKVKDRAQEALERISKRTKKTTAIEPS